MTTKLHRALRPLALGLTLAGAGSAAGGPISLEDVRITAGTQEHVVDSVPWSGTWWPFQSGKLAQGWTGADNFTYDASTETYAEKSGIADNDLSPLRKYDLFVKRREGTDPRAAWLELQGDDAADFHHHLHGARKRDYDARGVSYGWWGHCNGWSAASIMEREPIAPIVAEGIRFDVADLKGLLTESHWGVTSDFTGRRYNKPSDELKALVEQGQDLLDKLGTASQPAVSVYIAWYEDIYDTTIDASVRPNLTPQSFKSSLEHVRDWAKENWEEAYKDLYPHIFHKILVSQIQVRKQAVVFDVSADEEVWNFPAYWFRSQVTFVENLANGQKKFRVRTDVKYAHDGVDPAILGVNELAESYEYYLITDAEGRPVDGEWLGRSVDEHPDFAWVPTFNTTALDTGENPRLIYGKLLQILETDHAPGTVRKLDLQVRSSAGDVVRASSRIQAQATTTWQNPVSVTSPATFSVQADSSITKVTYYRQAVTQGSSFATATRNGLTQLAESTSGPSFEKSFAVQSGKQMIVAIGQKSDGRLVALSEITVQVGGTTPPPATDDSFEQNDTRDAATLLTAGSYPSLQCSDDDWYRIEVAQGQDLTVEIRFSHAIGDIDMSVFRGTTSVGSGTSATDDERVQVNGAAAGTYYVRVYGYSGARAGYDLTLGLSGGTTTPPTPTPTLQSFLAQNATLVRVARGEITVGRPSNGAHVTAIQNALLAVSPGSLPQFGADGDFGGETETAVKAFQAARSLPETGVVDQATILKLDEAVVSGGGTTPPTPPAGDDAFEENDTRQAAKTVAAGSHALKVRDDDWFKVSLTANQKVRAVLRFPHASGDLDMSMHDASGNQLGVSQGTTDTETLERTVTAAATIYLRVYGYGGATNDATLEVTVESTGGTTTPPTPPADPAEPNDSRAAASAVTIGGTYQGLRIDANDQDFYKVTLAANQSVTFTIRFTHSQGDLDMQLQNASGTQLAISQSTSNTETITYGATAAGTVYLRVYGYSGATGAYSLEVR